MHPNAPLITPEWPKHSKCPSVGQQGPSQVRCLEALAPENTMGTGRPEKCMGCWTPNGEHGMVGKVDPIPSPHSCCCPSHHREVRMVLLFLMRPVALCPQEEPYWRGEKDFFSQKPPCRKTLSHKEFGRGSSGPVQLQNCFHKKGQSI